MNSAIRMIVHTAPVSLPRNISGRNAPRPVDQRQPGYEEMFDDRTLFYDSMQVDDGVALIGPPLLNLEGLVSEGVFTAGSNEVLDVRINQLDRTSLVELGNRPYSPDVVTLSGKKFARTIPVGRSHLEVFHDRRVLVTKSKNNKLRWISDWVRFHVREQDVDAVLVYDNGSTDYEPEDVLEAITQDGVRSAVVVCWPYKFGPQGGNWNGLKSAPWDSDYCEYGIMEHARRRFLADASGVLNADIDELVLTQGDKTVFDAVNESSSGVVTYAGRWIETSGATGGDLSYDAYSYYDATRGATTAKWALDPSRARLARQWKTHSITGVHMELAEHTMHRHFMGINLNWKWQRTSSKPLTLHHRLDHELRDALQRSLAKES